MPVSVIYPQLDGVKINENRTLPFAVIQAIRRSYEYIAELSVASRLGTVVIEDLHENRETLWPAANEVLGSFYLETDRNEALYVVQEVSSAKVWVLIVGMMRGLLAARPADLGINDVGFLYTATDAADYRWSGTVWDNLGTVRGAANLTNVGAIPKVVSAGTLTESALTDDGSANVTSEGRDIGIRRYAASPAVRTRRANGTQSVPTAVTAGDLIGLMAGSGRGSTAYGTSRATVEMAATENWSDTQQGTRIQIKLTPTGTATLSGVLFTLDPSGTLDASAGYSAAGVPGVAGSIGVTLTTQTIQYKDWTSSNQVALVVTNVTIDANAFAGGIKVI